MVTIRFHFLADILDMNVDGPLVTLPRHVLKELQYFRTGEDPAGFAHESVKNIELDGGEVQHPAVPPDDALLRIKGQISIHKNSRLRFFGFVNLDSAHHRADPGGDFLQTEGFGDVVVGAEFQSDQLV
jgi:hypothetical protein